MCDLWNYYLLFSVTGLLYLAIYLEISVLSYRQFNCKKYFLNIGIIY